MKFQHWLIIIPLAHETDAIYSNRKKNISHTHTYIHFCVAQFRTYAAGGSGSEPELVLMILSSFFGLRICGFCRVASFSGLW